MLREYRMVTASVTVGCLIGAFLIELLSVDGAATVVFGAWVAVGAWLSVRALAKRLTGRS